MINEIGSEFPLPSEAETSGSNALSFLPESEDSIFVFSGRTAIETVLKDIGTAKKAMLPSYCCSSMIEPFLAAGIHVSFYKVNFNNKLTVDLELNNDCDILLWCNYFGFNAEYPHNIIENFRKRGGILIEDITHSLFSRVQHHDADYFVASLRKWGSLISGGYCSKVNGIFKNKPQLLPDEQFVDRKYKAMKLKSEYLLCNHQKIKDTYLNLFSSANKILSENYSNRLIDPQSLNLLSSWNIDEIRHIRKNNAKVIYDFLANTKKITPMFPWKSVDCPLFVPVLVDKNFRDSIRKKLIDENVFCPVHWPKPSADFESDIYDRELSLICDQRYNQDDMKRMMNIICNF